MNQQIIGVIFSNAFAEKKFHSIAILPLFWKIYERDKFLRLPFIANEKDSRCF